MTRITEKDLQSVCHRLNEMTNNPTEPWRTEGGKTRANVGCFHIDHAYGGVALHQMLSEGGGVRDVLHIGYRSKRELYEQMHAYLSGMADQEEWKAVK